MATTTLLKTGNEASGFRSAATISTEESLVPNPQPKLARSQVRAVNWRPVPDWPEYEVFSAGDVRRVGRASGAKPGRILRQLLNKGTGYYSVYLSSHANQKRIDVHRLVALAFLGHQPSSKHLVTHTAGSRSNNRVENLRWATQAENLQDCFAHGTALIGSKNPAALIMEIDVLAIRRMKAMGIPRPVIANGYGLHKRTVFAILAQTSWGHVQ
jgi:hypothetical protein